MEYGFPAGCGNENGPACDYHAKWEFDPENEDVHFEISARELGRWTGIGLSRDGNMVTGCSRVSCYLLNVTNITNNGHHAFCTEGLYHIEPWKISDRLGPRPTVM